MWQLTFMPSILFFFTLEVFSFQCHFKFSLAAYDIGRCDSWGTNPIPSIFLSPLQILIFRDLHCRNSIFKITYFFHSRIIHLLDIVYDWSCCFRASKTTLRHTLGYLELSLLLTSEFSTATIRQHIMLSASCSLAFEIVNCKYYEPTYCWQVTIYHERNF